MNPFSHKTLLTFQSATQTHRNLFIACMFANSYLCTPSLPLNSPPRVDELVTVPFLMHVVDVSLLQRPTVHFRSAILNVIHKVHALNLLCRVVNFVVFLTLLAALDRACKVVELLSMFD
jgi:hypothetical protein